MDGDGSMAIGEVARRAGVAPSALRFYERQGLIASERTDADRRRYPRAVLRRLAFIRAAQNVGLSLPEIREALDALPTGRAPTAADWERLSSGWRGRLQDQIDGLIALRDGLTGCIGCGCLSLTDCRLMNPGDTMASLGPGARRLPPSLRQR